MTKNIRIYNSRDLRTHLPISALRSRYELVQRPPHGWAMKPTDRTVRPHHPTDEMLYIRSEIPGYRIRVPWGVLIHGLTHGEYPRSRDMWLIYETTNHNKRRATAKWRLSANSKHDNTE